MILIYNIIYNYILTYDMIYVYNNARNGLYVASLILKKIKIYIDKI
jgi:hypothetical protein